MHGRGVFRYADGDVYEGDFKDDKRNGRGVYRYANGDVCEGDWKDGKIHGKVVCRFANGNVYEGDWMYDKMHGQGKMTYTNDEVYEGHFKYGKRHGQGKITKISEYPEIEGKKYVFEGNFDNDTVSGQGKLTYPHGSVYEGYFFDPRARSYGWGHLNGKGKMTFTNGTVYEGDCKNDIMHGRGVFRYANGDVYEGYWIYNQRHGQGVYRYANGDVYDGDWKDDKQHGRGKFTFANGNVNEEDWKDGNLQSSSRLYTYQQIVLKQAPAAAESNKLTRVPSNVITDQGKEGTCYAHATSHMLSRLFKVLIFKNNMERGEGCSLYYDTINCANADTPQKNIFQCIWKYISYPEDCISSKEILPALLFLFIYRIITKKFKCAGGNTIASIIFFFQEIKNYNTVEHSLDSIKKLLNYSEFHSIDALKDIIDIDDIITEFAEIVVEIRKISNDGNYTYYFWNYYTDNLLLSMRTREPNRTSDKYRNTKLYSFLHGRDTQIEIMTDCQLSVYMLEYVLKRGLYAILSYNTGEREGVRQGHAVTIVEYYDDTFIIKNSWGSTTYHAIGDNFTQQHENNLVKITKVNLLQLLSEDPSSQLLFVFPDQLIPDTFIGGGKKIKKSNRKKTRHLKSKTKRKYKNFK